MNKDKSTKAKEMKRRNKQRKVKKAMHLDDESFYKKELKGLNGMQKQKMIRKRKQLLKKEQMKNKNRAVNKQLKDAEKNDNNKDKKNLMKSPSINGKPSETKRKIGNVFKSNNNPNLYNETDNDSEVKDVKGRNKLLTMIKRTKTKNKKKKRKKARKRTQRFLFIMSSPIMFMIVAISIAIFIFSTTFFGGIIVSMALSHPKMVIELAEQNVLGNAVNIGNTVDDVEDADGNLLVKGKGNKSTAGDFIYDGEKSGGSSYVSTDKKDEPKKDGDSSSNGNTVKEADESTIQGKVWNKWRTLGHSKETTAGIMGNMNQESTFVINASNGTHFGMFQWDGVNRYPKAMAYCKEKGKDITTDWECQVEYADIELQSMQFTYGKDYKGFQKLDNVRNATVDFETSFERSGGSQLDQRINFANGFYDQFAK